MNSFKRYSHLILLATLFTTLLYTSCTEGETGPAGPAGPTGSAGIQGEKGETGSANVTSFTFLNRSLYKPTTKFDLPAITSEILEKGVVLGYLRIGGADTWYPLPYNILDYKVEVFSIKVGELVLATNFDAVVMDFRFVIIAGTTNTNMRSSTPPVDFTNYSAVKEYYHLPD